MRDAASEGRAGHWWGLRSGGGEDHGRVGRPGEVGGAVVLVVDGVNTGRRNGHNDLKQESSRHVPDLTQNSTA